MSISRIIYAVLLVLVFASAEVKGGSLDDYYLRRLGFPTSGAPVTGVVTEPLAAIAERCLTPVYRGLRRDWDRLEPQTKKALQKVLYAPVLQNQATFNSLHFTIHYATSGADAPPMADLNGNTIPDWVETVANVFEQVYDTEVTQMGYQAPPVDVFYHVYLQDLGSTRAFGFTETESRVSLDSLSFTSYISIDNDFADTIFEPYTGLSGLQITAAHEFQHAIQFGYNYSFEDWFAEATSTWIEDEVYDQVNQLYTYLSPYMRRTTLPLDAVVDTDTGGGYGRWIFNRHLAERFSATIIRDIWVRFGTLTTAYSPMFPVIDTVLNNNGSTLDDEFFLFSKKVYQRNWLSHPSEINLIPLVSSVTTYSSYPVNGSTSPAPFVQLPHYAFAYYFFQPTTSASADLALNVIKSSGIRTTGFKKTTGNAITEFPANSSGSVTVTSFNASDTAEAAFLISNSSVNDGQSGSFTTDSSTPPSQATNSAPASNGGGGGGCFIATAAYGSYLHPKVQILRHFRDDYLLKSAPGRAFVGVYYRLSPPLADFIARHDMLRTICRVLLTPIVFAAEYVPATSCFLLLAVLFWGATAGIVRFAVFCRFWVEGRKR